MKHHRGFGSSLWWKIASKIKLCQNTVVADALVDIFVMSIFKGICNGNQDYKLIIKNRVWYGESVYSSEYA